MKRVHQFKAGDLIQHHGAVFRILEDAKPCYGFALWARENGKCKPLAGPVDTAEARAEWVSGEPTPYFSKNTPWLFQGNFSTGLFLEVTQ
jgi:hypothetical protein